MVQLRYAISSGNIRKGVKWILGVFACIKHQGNVKDLCGSVQRPLKIEDHKRLYSP